MLQRGSALKLGITFLGSPREESWYLVYWVYIEVHLFLERIHINMALLGKARQPAEGSTASRPDATPQQARVSCCAKPDAEVK